MSSGKFFEREKNQAATMKVLLGVIVALLLMLLVAFKMVVDIAGNKEITISVPQYIDPGDYVIGTHRSSDNVYKMWGRVWLQELTNFNYKNIDEKIKFIAPFLTDKTVFKNKASLKELVQTIKENFVSQKFKIEKYRIKHLKKGYVKIIADGKLYRTVGLRKDKLNGVPFRYEIIAYTRNGQVYIKSLDSYIKQASEGDNRRKLEKNPYVNFDDIIKEDKKRKEEARKARKKKIKEGGI